MANPIAHIGTPGTSSYTVDWSARQRGQENMWKGISQLLHTVGEQQRNRADQKSLAEVMAFVGDGQKLLTEATKRGIPLAKVREAVDIHSKLQPKESTEPFANFFNPATDERQAARRGSKEAATLAQGGWLSGNPESTTPTQRRTAKDQNDVLRYLDDQAPVFPGVTPTPKRERAQIGDVMRLADEWQQATPTRPRTGPSAGPHEHRPQGCIRGQHGRRVPSGARHVPENPRSHQRRSRVRICKKLVRPCPN